MSAPLQRLDRNGHAMGRMLYTEDEITCPIVPEPNDYHLTGRCEDCDTVFLSRMNLGKIEDLYHVGRVTQDQYEAYTYVWALLSPTGSRPYDRATPTDPTVRRIARKLLRLRGFEVPAALVEPQTRFLVVRNNGQIVPGKPWHVFDTARDRVAYLAGLDVIESTHRPECACGCHNHGPLAYFATEGEAAQWLADTLGGAQ